MSVLDTVLQVWPVLNDWYIQYCDVWKVYRCQNQNKRVCVKIKRVCVKIKCATIKIECASVKIRYVRKDVRSGIVRWILGNSYDLIVKYMFSYFIWGIRENQGVFFPCEMIGNWNGRTIISACYELSVIWIFATFLFAHENVFLYFVHFEFSLWYLAGSMGTCAGISLNAVCYLGVCCGWEGSVLCMAV